MKATRFFVGGFVLAAALVPGTLRAAEPVDVEPVAPHGRVEPVVPQGRLAADVAIRDVRTAGDTVSGVVVNRSRNPVRDVKLVVNHTWLWDNEMHPGVDEYSRADYYIVKGDIPPGGEAPFTLRPTEPLQEGRGGHFMTNVGIASVTEIVPGASRSPTAGTGSVEPAPRRMDDESGRPVRPMRQPDEEDLGD